MVVRGAWVWAGGLVVASAVLGCAEPCVDDGFLKTQHAANCGLNPTSSGTATSAEGSTTEPTSSSTATATTEMATTGTSTTNMVAMTDASTTSAGTSGDASTGSSTGAGDCMDGAKNGDETDIDCGGGSCAACENGQRCAGEGSNCMSAQCNGDLCVELKGCVLAMSDTLVTGNGPEGLDLLSLVGDCDGDLVSDLFVGAPSLTRGYVLLGGTLDQDIDLAVVMGGEGGYFVSGSEQGFAAVSPAGDFNQDGLADLAVGTEFLSLVRVVFGPGGKPPFAKIDTDNLGNAGFTMVGDSVGSALAGGLDVDGDGDGDLVVGARLAGQGNMPMAYVVFSDPSLADFVADDVGGPVGGFQIHGPMGTGGALALLPSVNGDALAEVVVGAGTYGESVGRAYVVHGKADAAPVQLDALGAGGFAITTAKMLQLGDSLAAAGDVNGDGLADVVVGSGKGKAWVVFGKADTDDVDVDALGAGGFAIDLLAGGTARVAAGADLDGDGRAEVLVSELFGNLETLWVVFGKADTATVVSADLDMGKGGFAIRATEPVIGFGTSVVVGDLLGLGANSLAVSAPDHAEGAGEVLVFTPGLCN